MSSECPNGPEGEPAHRARATPHHPRRLFGGEASDKAKDDRLLLVWRKARDRAAQLADLLAAQADRLDLLSVRQIMDRVKLLGGALATNVVDHRVARDAKDPGGEGAATGAVTWQSRDDALEDELGQILGVLAATNPHRDVPIDRSEELVVEVAKGRNVAIRSRPAEDIEPCVMASGRLGIRRPTLSIGDWDIEDDLQGSLAHVAGQAPRARERALTVREPYHWVCVANSPALPTDTAAI